MQNKYFVVGISLILALMLVFSYWLREPDTVPNHTAALPSYNAARHIPSMAVQPETRSTQELAVPLSSNKSALPIASVTTSSVSVSMQTRGSQSVSSKTGLWTSSSRVSHSVGGGGVSTLSSPSLVAHRRNSVEAVAPAVSPTLAYQPMRKNRTSTQTVTMRYAKPTYTGYDGQVVTDNGETWTWDDEAKDWTNTTPEGATKEEGGIHYRWDGSNWVVIKDVAQGVQPIGDMPLVVWAMLLCSYTLLRVYRKQKNKAKTN